ncbi:MAG: hypothetical protein ACI815_000238 [Psychroserpens sp.]
MKPKDYLIGWGAQQNSPNRFLRDIHAMVHLAKKKYFKDKVFPKLNTGLHEGYKDGQLSPFQ